MSIFRQTTEGDLDLSSHALVVEREPDREVAHRLSNRFRLIRGEWQFNTSIGVPYFERIFFAESKGTVQDLPLIRNMIFGILQTTPGVETIDTLDLQLTQDRLLVVHMGVRSQSGALISGQLGEPFIVETNKMGALITTRFVGV